MLVVPSFAMGSVWYVDNEVGQDSNSGLTATLGTSASGPFRTIQRALNAANIGDTIVLAKTSSPYRESLSFAGGKNSGLASLPFRLIGNGSTLSGTMLTPARKWELVEKNLFKFRPNHGAFQMLYLKDRPAKFQTLDFESLSQLQPRSWTLIKGNIYFRTDDNLLPDAYALSHAYLQTGITLYGVKNVSIENLVIQGFWLDGVNAHDNVRNTQLIGVTSRGNGRSGVSVGGCSHLDINSCLLGDNQKTQLRTESVAKVRLIGSSLLDNATGPMIQKEGGTITEVAAVDNNSVPANVETKADPSDTTDPFGFSG